MGSSLSRRCSRSAVCERCADETVHDRPLLRNPTSPDGGEREFKRKVRHAGMSYLLVDLPAISARYESAPSATFKRLAWAGLSNIRCAAVHTSEL